MYIKDEYFEKVNDCMLMQNKENGTYRPTFYCLKDEKTSLLRMPNAKNSLRQTVFKGFRTDIVPEDID